MNSLADMNNDLDKKLSGYMYKSTHHCLDKLLTLFHYCKQILDRSLRLKDKLSIYCRVPGKWGLQQTNYPPEQTGHTNSLACLTKDYFHSNQNKHNCKEML